MIRRVGGSDNILVNVRVITAMNEHPSNALGSQKLRMDLYYRLNVFTFSLPPLRERPEDILFLTDYFIQTFNQKLHKNIQGVENNLKTFLITYPWPGNVRELKHTIEYMMNVCEGDWLAETDLPIILKTAHNFS